MNFLRAVSPPAAPLTVVFGVLAVGAAALERVESGASDWVLASIALVQLFASSTGFTRPATRGHYDPILLGRSRVSVALSHFAVSAAPGGAAWIACGVAQSLAAGSARVPAFLPAGWATILLVSAIPWAASVRSSPFLGGALWLLLSVSLVVSGRVLGPLGSLHGAPSWAAEHPLEAFGLGLAFPVAIPSLAWPPGVLAAFVGTAALAVAGAVVIVARADYPLAEEGA
ncbi:MAG TPA: hypothetical protein VLG15_08275 [Thermoanaerobaculia bacterium]|nr:hypothetical protein [Thermoanaerobaculia bacterium]